MILVGNGPTITRDPENPFLENGAVLIKDKLIARVGPDAELRREFPDARYIDAKGGIIMPGFINAHMHYYSAFSRGFGGKGGAVSQNFEDVLANLWWRLDKALMLEDTYYSAMVCMIDCIKNGCTTVIDHHASPKAVLGSLGKIAEAARQTGIRTCLAYEVSDRDGDAIMREGIKENIDAIKLAASDKTGLLAGMFGLHASMTLSNDTLAACAEAMAGIDAGYHVHVAEGPGDEVDSEKRYGKRIVERFHDYGLTGDKAIFVHCIHINDAEKDILKNTGTAVVHNPESNMGNAVGCSPVLDMYQRGILLGLGTDGFVSDMLQAFKMANALQKHHNQHPSVAWGEIPAMLFDNNRVIAQRYFPTPTGMLRKNCAADVIISDYQPPTELSDKNINGHLLFGTTGRSVVTTIAGGRVLMEDRHLTELDGDGIVAKARECSKKVWERF